MNKAIINKVHGTALIPWQKLKTFEFNDLKEGLNRDVSKLKNSIVNDGFSFPFYLWKNHNYIIDGNGRNIALNELENEGYLIPELPVVEIEANTKQHAKKLVLLASSSYGKVTRESYDLFIEDIDLELEDIELKIENINFSNTEIQDSEEFGTDFSLPEGDKAPFQQMTFTLADEQANFIKDKIDEIKKTDEYKYCETFGNENSNGNALYCLIRSL